MLYTWNLFSAVCQLYLNKTGRKKDKVKVLEILCNQMPIEEHSDGGVEYILHR